MLADGHVHPSRCSSPLKTSQSKANPDDETDTCGHLVRAAATVDIQADTETAGTDLSSDHTHTLNYDELELLLKRERERKEKRRVREISLPRF